MEERIRHDVDDAVSRNDVRLDEFCGSRTIGAQALHFDIHHIIQLLHLEAERAATEGLLTVRSWRIETHTEDAFENRKDGQGSEPPTRMGPFSKTRIPKHFNRTAQDIGLEAGALHKVVQQHVRERVDVDVGDARNAEIIKQADEAIVDRCEQGQV